MITYFPWYQDYLSSTDVNTLSELPLMTTEILEKHYYHQDFDSSWTVYQTSGTSSKNRKKIAYSIEDDEEYLKKKIKVYAQFIQNKNIRTAMADMGTGHAASTSIDVFRKLGLVCEEIPFHLPVKEHVDRLQRFQPDLFYTMPSILENILSSTEKPEQFGIKKIILVGEVASMEWQKKVASRLHIDPKDIMDTYGSIEIGTIAYYSHAHRCYLFVDDMMPEGIKAEEIGFDPDLLRENERILALTSFSRKTFPAARFVTYDVVRDFKPITVDGKIVPSFRALVKRVGTEWKHGEKISLYDIEEVVYRNLAKATFWVQADKNQLVVWIDSADLTDSIRIKVQQEIQEKIPEIGTMIKNGILDEIQVKAITDPKQFETDRVKKKIIYHQRLDRI